MDRSAIEGLTKEKERKNDWDKTMEAKHGQKKDIGEGMVRIECKWKHMGNRNVKGGA